MPHLGCSSVFGKIRQFPQSLEAPIKKLKIEMREKIKPVRSVIKVREDGVI